MTPTGLGLTPIPSLASPLVTLSKEPSLTQSPCPHCSLVRPPSPALPRPCSCPLQFSAQASTEGSSLTLTLHLTASPADVQLACTVPSREPRGPGEGRCGPGHTGCEVLLWLYVESRDEAETDSDLGREHRGP